MKTKQGKTEIKLSKIRDEMQTTIAFSFTAMNEVIKKNSSESPSELTRKSGNRSCMSNLKELGSNTWK